jgi:hypothetical protein
MTGPRQARPTAKVSAAVWWKTFEDGVRWKESLHLHDTAYMSAERHSKPRDASRVIDKLNELNIIIIQTRPNNDYTDAANGTRSGQWLGRHASVDS